MELKFDKEFQEAPEGEESEYRYILKDENGNEKPVYAVFGIYTNHDITDYKGKVLINKDQLMDVITVNKGEQVDVKLDLPEGDYYYKELYVTEPYVIDQDRYDFNITYTEENLPVLDVKGKTVTNYPDTADIALLKLSTATVAPASGYGIMENGKVDPEILEENSAAIYDRVRRLSLEEMMEYFSSNEFMDNFLPLNSAEYGVYLDEACTIPLQRIKLDGTQTEPENTVVTTGENGMFVLENIPLGTYWLKELDAPYIHEISDAKIEVNLHDKDSFSKVFRVAFDDDEQYSFRKEDVFTGDSVPNCEFRITDKDGNEITNMVTNEEGDALISLSLFQKGETYYYEEISAEDSTYYEDGVLYELNTEKHPFVMDYTVDELTSDVIFAEQPVISNYRPSTRELIVRKVDEETGEPLQGCKFSIVLLDENGEPYVNEDGETIYMVKDAVTDENGEYRVENPLYGSYRFIEVEAPEGYDLAEQEMDGYEFTIDDETPDTLIFEVTNTGDIAVVVLASIAVVSVIGIVYVVLRNKKKLA